MKGIMEEVYVDEQEIQAIVEQHNGNCGGLIALLEEVQNVYGYLPESALRQVADTSGRSLVDIYGVATFYRSFSLQPRGRHHVCVCLGTACHVRNAPVIVEEFERQLDIQAGETTSDGEFTLEKVNCLGACALGPIVAVDGVYHSKVDTAGVRKILNGLRTKVEELDSEPLIAI